ncbi:MAG: hypothetical protein H0T57_01580 [Rubrobacter sp.]|nr:hypothetical protein [Rubrobacter sp.]
MLTLVGVTCGSAQVGLPLLGIQLNPALGYAFVVLAVLSFLGALIALFWFWAGRLASWSWCWIKGWWPFALARTVKRLKAEKDESEKQKDKLKEENKVLIEERDAQLKQRCLELSDDLDTFLKCCQKKGFEEQEAMRQYEQLLLSRRAAALIHDLKRREWWKPKKSEKERIEYPANQEDIQSLSGCIRWVFYLH